MGRRLPDVEEVFTSLVEKTNRMELKMNEENTKFITLSRRCYNENKRTELGTYNF
jgi:hypothetical protein